MNKTEKECKCKKPVYLIINGEDLKDGIRTCSKCNKPIYSEIINRDYVNRQIKLRNRKRCITRRHTCRANLNDNFCDLSKKTFICPCKSCKIRQVCIDNPYNNAVCDVGASTSPSISSPS